MTAKQPRILEDKTPAPATGPVADEPRAPDGETKAEAFKRLVIPRMERALNTMRIVGNLSVRGNYEYTQEQVDAIERALLDEVETTIKRFRHTGTDKRTFRL